MIRLSENGAEKHRADGPEVIRMNGLTGLLPILLTALPGLALLVL